MLNRYVFDDQDNLVNLTTKKVLPKNSSLDVLRDNFFLEGQEQESLGSALFEKTPVSLNLTLVPTWECNLRCTHCFVLHELLKEDKNYLNPDRLLAFIERYKKRHPGVQRVGIYFLGGEPALRAKDNVIVIKGVKALAGKLGIEVEFAATSNGVDINRDILEFYSILDSLAISVDGNKEYHDSQRKSPDHKSAFEKTLKTIRTLVKFGMRDKIKVQAAVDQESFNEDLVLEFHKTMLMAGVKLENLHFGINAPTNQNPELGDKFLDVCRNRIYSKACCKYRFMNNFIIDSRNNVYCDYFRTSPENLLGSLDDPISKMEDNHKSIIQKSMPVLNDAKCMECPVIGACWGWCCNLVGLVKPSKHCDQAGLIEKIKESAGRGDLVSLLHLNADICTNAN